MTGTYVMSQIALSRLRRVRFKNKSPVICYKCGKKIRIGDLTHSTVTHVYHFGCFALLEH